MNRHEQDTEEAERSRHGTGDRLIDAMAAVPRGGASVQGTWPADDIRRVFVEGAKWWEFHQSKGTMWGSDVTEAEEEATRRYPPSLAPVVSDPPKDEHPLPATIAEIRARLAKITPGPRAGMTTHRIARWNSVWSPVLIASARWRQSRSRRR
jgi:hypothetical protein